MKKLMIVLMLCTMLSLVGAVDYQAHQQSTSFGLIVTSNNATGCNITSIQYSDGTQAIVSFIMTKNVQTFNYTVDSGNFSLLGNICFGVTCTDGSQIETGSVCRNVIPTSSGEDNTTFFIMLILIASGLLLAGFLIHNYIFSFFSGLAFLITGVYGMIYGYGAVTNTYTQMISLVIIGLGALLTILSALDLLGDVEGKQQEADDF